MSVADILNPSAGNVIQVADVRHFIMDRVPDDNELDLDLFFTDEEIAYAMRFACMYFNSIPPKTLQVSPNAMPFHMEFLFGIVYHLYLSKIQQLGRNIKEYNAGGVSVSRVPALLAEMKAQLPEYRDTFVRYTQSTKLKENLTNGWGLLGGGCC